MSFPEMERVLVANSTPIVVLESGLKLFLVKRVRRLDFPTPESPSASSALTAQYDFKEIVVVVVGFIRLH